VHVRGSVSMNRIRKLVSLCLALMLALSASCVNAYGITLTDLPTLKDDGIDGSMMKPDSPAFGSSDVTIKSIWDEVIKDLPTLKDDGIDGSMMKPDSPAFGSSDVTVKSIWDNMDCEINSTSVFEDNVNVPKNKTGQEGERITTFKLQEDEDTVEVEFISSQNEDDMDQINVSLVNYSSGTVIDWYPGLKVNKAAEFSISDPSYTDYYAIYVSTNQVSTNARIKAVTK